MEVFNLYKVLLDYYGFQNWWPVYGNQDKVAEISIGAILTQNTSWNNVEKSIKNLIKENCLSFECIDKIDIEKLKNLIKPSGFYNQKSRTLKDLAKLFLSKKDIGREDLLSIKGIGQETAESILLYALDKPYFVVDNYTKRLFYRLGFTAENISYSDLQKFITGRLPVDLEIYKEFHALIVKHCKEFCQKKPKCENCFLSHKCIFKKVV
ncbi:endonuclease III domain-containing protein [Sulfurihydrogenibium azorense]|uniref:Endonuclease III n=1 Tax=Sulfurihydrogenibium azorense (strain DSM 15241 / OCM 825 / Az-Fu1) TaxID=204536 RepID=C1DV60_SULAA|nr:endonuclease III domain-containing protein [Sulfurihydrogenibium azorense]ACN99652.1 endonuclease III [Sulfurihydrogenibium azorense Az-Fu1]MDM7273191.1 endonuclease III domain-containing protein [Sulfurihydrogenibium azorense]